MFVMLKIYIRTSLIPRELLVYPHRIRRIRKSIYRGRRKIRKLVNSFEFIGIQGKYMALVFEAAL